MAELTLAEELKIDEAVIQRANALKDEGNAFLQHGRYAQAAEKYTAAIELNPTAIYYSNRAQALIKLESYGLAISDANEALKLDPKYIKAYYRRGSANYALGKLKLALKDFKSVATIVPKDPDAQKKLKACEKDIREEAFQKAIESDTVRQEDLIDFASLTVEDSYSGPRVETDPTTKKPILTMDFVKELQETFKNQKLLHRKYVIQLLYAAIEYFTSLPTLLRLGLPRDGNGDVSGSFTVCGDTHGQYYDLCNIFELNGLPSETNYFLFNGDFVDRGSFSFETVFLLMTMKLTLPNSLHMLRGNHETKNMNKIYGFLGEIKHKYDDKIMGLFSRLFQALPLAAVIENKVFVVHGGISTQDNGEFSLDEVSAISRFREPPESGLMSDLLWSDPQAHFGKSPSKRGLGFSFGPDFTHRFLAHNKLQLLIRSHEVREEGYDVDHGGKCITVFSAPNYCDEMGNKGAMIKFTDPETMQPNFIKFEAVPHPNVPPMRYAGNTFSL